MIRLEGDTAPLTGGCVLTIGNFDGVHIGHRALIEKTVDTARSLSLPAVVWSFKQHPQRLLGGTEVRYIIGPAAKERQIRLLGADIYYAAEFADYKDMAAEEFVDTVLIKRFKVRHVLCGYSFSFGKGGKGNAALLKTLLQKHGVALTVMPAVTVDGVPVSSTRLRGIIAEGDMAKAAELLGRYYSFSLPVTEGRRLGRTMGSPTINQLFPEGRVLPAFGVYAVFCDIDSAVYGGVANIGLRPTVTGGTGLPVCETHIFDFNGDLYGKDIRVYLYKRLRAEIRFESLQALSKQIALDAAEAKRLIAQATVPKGDTHA